LSSVFGGNINLMAADNDSRHTSHTWLLWLLCRYDVPH